MFSQTRSLTHAQSQPSTHITPATLDHTSLFSGPSRKSCRKPGFQVFCDDDAQETVSSAKVSSHRTKSGTALQTVVNNKENQIPELNNTPNLSSRQAVRALTHSRVLSEKTLLASARVNCVEKWDSDVSVASCHTTASRKSTQPHPIKTDFPQTPASSHSQPFKESKRKSKVTASQSQPSKRLSSHIYHPIAENVSQSCTYSHPVDDGFIELVSKLEALQAKDHETLKILDPLPPNAPCPGAPKMPSTFTIPLFIDEEDLCDCIQSSELKTSNSHRISPLAEVTEAFTGLQGGWSPPRDTLAPLFQTQLSQPPSTESNEPQPS